MPAAPPKLDPRLLANPVHLLALGFGAGLAPLAPGTCGTALAVPFTWLLLHVPWPWRLAIVVAAIVAGIWICGRSARLIGTRDHPGIVWDEIAAMLALSLALPPGIGWLGAAFLLFRAFDIVKPWPIRDVDHRLTGGAGIMLDDLVAAVYTAACLWLVNSLEMIA